MLNVFVRTILSHPGYEDVYRAGREMGQSLENQAGQCPYPTNVAEHVAWMDGFSEGRGQLAVGPIGTERRH